MANPQSFLRRVGGRDLIIETGRLAGLANGAATIRYGDTVVLVTVCSANEPRPGVDFLPLTVDYEERLYAAGKIPGGFIRREGRPSEAATLAARLTDRPLRPLLPKSWRKDIQIVCTVLSADQENPPDLLAVIGGSAVLSISDIPFYGPVGAVGVGILDGKFVVNPTLAGLDKSPLDLVVVSTKDAVVMLEAGAKEISEEKMFEAIQFAHEANQEIIRLQEDLKRALGKAKVEAPPSGGKPQVIAAVKPFVEGKITAILLEPDKTVREQNFEKLRHEVLEQLVDSMEKSDILGVFDAMVKAELRANVLNNNRRPGGRNFTQIRPISCEVGLMPRTHGSALFTRGLTQVMTIATLGSKRQEQQLDGLGIEETKRFIHHYNFPPFSNGETGRVGTPGRREIGHGALAERGIIPVLPDEEEFPYTIRLVSEVLSSNGSTSMASTCASSLSLMDAGIPIKKQVAGVAMGLVTDETGRFAVLTDIEGLEDNYGDMDFKVAGTSAGITAIQMDTKIKGLSYEIINKALQQAKEARGTILEIMNRTISSSRPEISKFAPRMYKISINADKIGAVIGTGGKTIRAISSETDSTIDIEDDGTVIVGSPNEESARKAIAMIEGLTKEAEVGQIYTGKVSRILNFGVMVEFLPGKEGMVHISELADFRVAKCEDVVKIGDEVTVKVIGVDNMGRVNLSRKAVSGDNKGNNTEGTLPPPTGSNPPPRPAFRPQGRPQDRRSGPPDRQR